MNIYKANTITEYSAIGYAKILPGASIASRAGTNNDVDTDSIINSSAKIELQINTFSFEEELAKINEAIGDVKLQLKTINAELTIEELSAKTAQAIEETSLKSSHSSKEKSQIVDATLLILEDEGLLGAIKEKLSPSCHAKRAVEDALDEYEKRFLNLPDEYMRARAADIRDIKTYLLRALDEKSIIEETEFISKDTIIIAKDITAAQLLSFMHSQDGRILSPAKDKRDEIYLEKTTNLKGVVLLDGNALSHVVILAKSMGIPMIVNCDMCLDDVCDGMAVAIDVQGSVFITDPTCEQKEKILNYIEQKEKIDNYMIINNLMINQDGIDISELTESTVINSSGKKITLLGNISTPHEVDAVFANGGEGIGLYRSEFLLMGKKDAPSEDEQFEIYKELLLRANGKKVVVRTFDLGSDKTADFLPLKKEENPALGIRGVRLYKRYEELFMTQIRALLCASKYGNLKIMYPMITSVDEVDYLLSKVDAIANELDSDIIVPSQGIMIETPAAVMISDLLAEKVDFFSIGTNDLTQYTLAADRQNSEVYNMYNESHPALKRMISHVCKVAHDAGIKVSVCGEMAGDENMTAFLLEAGVDELSMNATSISKVGKTIKSLL